MIKFSKIIIIYIVIGIASSCSQVLETVELKVNSEDVSNQEEFKVVEKTLTLKQALKQSKSPYKRMVLQPARGNEARAIPESIAIQSKFPAQIEADSYRIGIGDTLTFSRLIENDYWGSDAEPQWPENRSIFNYRLGIGDNLALTLLREEKTLSRMAPGDSEEDQSLILESQNELLLETKGRIGSDGSVLLLEVGRLEAKDKTLGELQSEVRNILIRNGTSPRFQLEIIEFKSQRAYLTINNNSNVILLDDQKTTLKDILASSAVGFNPGIITYIQLQRDSKEYLFSLRSVFSESAPDIEIYAGDHIFVEDSSTSLKSSVSRVGHDGNAVFSGIGKIMAVGKTLDDLRTEISSLIEKIPGSENEFQIEISEFSSQTALISIPGVLGGVVPITTSAIALDEVLIENGLGIDTNNIVKITLERNGKSYVFTLEELLKLNSKRIYLKPNDRVKTETLKYKANKVFILGGISPQIFKIEPANRETLADVLFTNQGTLSSSSAKRSEVYLLRGTDPVIAFHLDAQSPTRLIVADAMELRPNDILFVAEKPIISFNRTLTTILPLRILLRDIQDENIP